LLFFGLLSAACTACSSGAGTDAGGIAVIEQQLQGAIASSSRHSVGSIEVLASPVHVHVLLSDDKLARADEGTQERAAQAVAAGVERVIASDNRLRSVDAISVSIIHPERAHGLLWSSHTEDVYYFTKGPDQHFSLDPR
jgi:hypothetical protein